MKKLLVLLLLLSYGLSSFGMTLHIHYCCGKVDNVKLAPVKDHSCGVDKPGKKKACCDDKQVDLKIKADYKNESSAWLKIKSFAEAPVVAHFFQVVAAGSNVFDYRKNYSPPHERSVPLYIQHCIYRI